MSRSDLFAHFAARFGIRRSEAGEFFDELQQLTEQELLRCREFVLPGVAKLMVQQRGKRMGRNPATGARVEIPAKQVVKARIAKQLRDIVESYTTPTPSSRSGGVVAVLGQYGRVQN